MMKTMILFMAYYGKLPSYFPVWLKAVELNKTIDFCLITDCISDDEGLPKNIKLLNISFDDFKDRVQDKFAFKINMENYGRISQFRPAFAYIFDDIVQGYDNWGFIECDLIPGDIRAFLTDDILNKYDKVFKLGHFQVYKNTPEMNQLFMSKTYKALNYKFAFSHNIIYFEEVIGMYNIALAEKKNVYDKRVFVDVKCKELMFIRSSFSYEGESEEECLFEYDHGKLYEYFFDERKKLKKREVLYLHIQKRMMEINTDNLEHYLIIPNEFVRAETLDANYWKRVKDRLKNQEVEYYNVKDDAAKKIHKKQIKNPDWWLMYFIRVRLKMLHCVGLSGKRGVL